MNLCNKTVTYLYIYVLIDGWVYVPQQHKPPTEFRTHHQPLNPLVTHIQYITQSSGQQRVRTVPRTYAYVYIDVPRQ